MTPDGARLLGLCLAEVATMTAFMAFPATLPLLQRDWGLSGSAAGLVGAGYQAGYVALVPVLAFLTDHRSPARIYVGAAAVAAAATAGFGLLARGFWTALLLHTLMGAGLAGTYMPGMRLVAERCRAIPRGRAIGAYVAAFSLGTSLSLFLVGAAARAFGWRVAFLAAAVGPALAAGVAWRAFRGSPAPVTAAGAGARAPAAATLASLAAAARAVAANRPVLRLIAAYFAHCFELFGVRAWLPAFFTAVLAASGASLESAAARAAAVSGAVLLAGGLANLASGVLSDRIGRRRTAASALVLSGLLSCVIGFAAGLPLPALIALAALHAAAVLGDSAALSAGITESADPRHLGATMALQSFSGFGSAVVSTAAFGWVLDLAGWGVAFASLGVVALAGAAALALGER